ncbi:MAG: hypothetical protein NT007_18030 [Candidatus Kapabacteria bacterium]|nr:hypothetical protein [Candidatus Kapabacteria bacterium]
MTKIDDSLLEVWLMKEKVIEDYQKSNYKNLTEFITDSVKELKVKYNIKDWNNKMT